MVAPRDPELLEKLEELGFHKVTALDPWEEAVLGRTRVKATPSQHDEPEFGPIISDGQIVFWHMADAEVDAAVGERVLKEAGKVDVVASKYQPVVNASMSYLRDAGSSFAPHEVCDWLEAACVARPRFAFPYASGLAFAGEHAWFNRYAFPLTQDDAARLLQQRLGPDAVAQAVYPGDVIEAEPDAIRCLSQAADFVKTVPSALSPRWEPVDTSTLPGPGSATEQRELADLLASCLSGPFGRWMGEALRNPESPWRNFVGWGVVWQLVVHASPDERLCYSVDFRDPARISLAKGENAEANFFTHLAGNTLLRVLRHEVPGMMFWLVGAVRSYEKIILVRDGHFGFPPFPPEAEFRPSDPLTYFLRYHWSEEQAAPSGSERPRHEHGKASHL